LEKQETHGPAELTWVLNSSTPPNSKERRFSICTLGLEGFEDWKKEQERKEKRKEKRKRKKKKIRRLEKDPSSVI